MELTISNKYISSQSLDRDIIWIIKCIILHAYQRPSGSIRVMTSALVWTGADARINVGASSHG